jgi:hypothetical protein
VNWQAGPPAQGRTGDLFAQTEEAIRGLVAAPWWRTAPPVQRADVVTSHMLAGAGEWWLYGAWGRWYRSGLDGNWHPCPAPADPAARRAAGTAPRGAGNPPVPPQLIPAGPDLAAGRVAATGFVSGPPPTAVVARVQQALITALSVNPAEFVLRDPAFAPGTPSTVAAAWGALLWCAGSPVAVAEHPLIELIAPYLTIPRSELRWMTAPDLAQLAGYYGERLRAGDAVGAAHVVRVLAEIAAALRTDPAFRPGAHALDAIAAATTQMIRFDMGGIRLGVAAVAEQWRRRCPAEFAPAVMREAAPGEFFRLALYDLEDTVRALHAGGAAGQSTGQSPTAIRHAAIALLAADLGAVPAAIAAVVPWLDPDSVRTLHAVAAQADHPLRRLWPEDGRLPAELRPAEPAGGERDAAAAGRTKHVEALLATSYALGQTWCRLAQITPPAPGFVVAAAAAAELRGAAARAPKRTGELTAWQIIEAARAHLAAGRVKPAAAAEETVAESPAASPTPASAAPVPEPAVPEPAVPEPAVPEPLAPGPDPVPGPRVPGSGMPGPPGEESFLPVAEAIDPPAGPPVPGPPPPAAAALGVPNVVEAHGIRFLCGLDDVGLLLTELRRRGQWAQRLRGQEVSSASAPGLLLVGAPSSGQRRLARMVAKALAAAGIGSGEIHGVDAAALSRRGPDEVRAVLDEHAGHTVLLDGLDALVFADEAGPAFAAALYRARVEGVSQTTLIATCPPDRMGQLSAAYPELATDFRIVRLPDLSDPAARVALLELLARERRLVLAAAAWEIARRDMGRMRGRGRLAGGRLVEAYLDRAATRHLGRAGDTQSLDDAEALTLVPPDFEGVAEELEPSLRDLRDVDAYLAELHALAGLRPVKDAVERIVAEARVAAARRRAGLPVAESRRHLAFAGGAGTGKTTVARLIGKLFAVIGPLESGHTMECAPADLAGADETKAKVSEALGGVLVLDLPPGPAAAATDTAATADPVEPAGPAALPELTALMDDRSEEFIVIVTGGRDELPDFLAAAPALRERLAEVIVFPDPTDADLVEIFRRCAEQRQYVLEDELVAALPERMGALRAADGYAGGHSVRRLFDAAVARQSVRMVRDGATMSADQLTLLTAADLPE